MKKKYPWRIFLVLIVFLSTLISVYFIFRHFRHFRNKEDSVENNSPLKKNNIEDNPNFSWKSIQPTKDEPEYQGKLLPISSAGTEKNDIVIKAKMLPRGSAIITSSGDLEKQQIKAIIHAVPGAMARKDVEFEPNLKGLVCSIQNSIILAEKNNYESIAFPLADSKFIDLVLPSNQGSRRERKLRLAEIIIKAVINQRKKLKKIVFVEFGDNVFTEAGAKIAFEEDYNKKLGQGMEVKIVFQKSKGITDYDLHECELIVNTTFNMEGKFNGSKGISGLIAIKTGSGKNKIQNEIREHLAEFNTRLRSNKQLIKTL